MARKEEDEQAARRLQPTTDGWAERLRAFFVEQVLDEDVADLLLVATYRDLRRGGANASDRRIVDRAARRQLARYLRHPGVAKELARLVRTVDRRRALGLSTSAEAIASSLRAQDEGRKRWDRVARQVGAASLEEVLDSARELPDFPREVLIMRVALGMTNAEVARAMLVRERTVRDFYSSALRGIRGGIQLAAADSQPQPVLVGPDGTPLTPSSSTRRELEIRITEITEEVIARLAADPTQLYGLTPRRFEELVAELYRRRGFETTLTPLSGDGGADVLVVRHDELGSSLSVVQAKRYSPHNKVGVGIVRELQGTMLERGASAGVVLTTSWFTSGARKYEAAFRYRVSLQDYDGLIRLLHLPPAPRT
jgi:DNA-directed RNA polymerase specialized sigma24 family protein